MKMTNISPNSAVARKRIRRRSRSLVSGTGFNTGVLSGGFRFAACGVSEPDSSAKSLRRLAGEIGIELADRGAAIGALEPAQREMTLRDPLKVIHENHIDGRPADRAEDRQRARGSLVGHHKAKA